MEKELRILLIDDSDVDAFLIADTLEESKFQVNYRRLNTAEAAIDYLSYTVKKEELPQIVLLDLDLPVMNGFELLDELNEIYDQELERIVQVYILTNSVYLRDVEKVERYPEVKGFLRKPLRIDQFEGLVDSY